MSKEKKIQDKELAKQDKRNRRYINIFHEKQSRYLEDMLTTENNK